MATFDEILQDLQQTELLGNSVFDFLVSVSVFIVSIIILLILKSIIFKRLSKLEALKDNKTTTIIIKTTQKYLSNTLIVILAIYFATRNIKFLEVFNYVIDVIVFGIIGWLLMKFLLNLLDAILEYQRSLDIENVHILEFFRIFIRSFIIIIVALWFLSNIGVDVTTFMASLGFVSLAIAFALRQTIADIFASIIIFIDRPFEIEDTIKFDNMSGTVESIGIRSTRIRAPEGHLIVASNRELSNKKIHNLKRMNTRRVEMMIEIDQSTPSSQLQRIPRMIEEIVSSDAMLEFDKINLTNIGNYAHEYNLVYFVNTRDFETHAKAKQELFFTILDKFREEDIMIPYPTQTILIDE